MSENNTVVSENTVKQVQNTELAAEAAFRFVHSEAFAETFETEKQKLLKAKAKELQEQAARLGFSLVATDEAPKKTRNAVTKKVTRPRIEVTTEQFDALWNALPDKKADAITAKDLIETSGVDEKVAEKVVRDWKKKDIVATYPNPNHEGKGRAPLMFYAAKGAKPYWV